MGTLILVGVIVFVVAAFVGLVWLFVKISSSPEARAREAELQAKAGPIRPSPFGRRAESAVVARAGKSQSAGTGAASRKKQGKKAKGRKAR